MGNPILPVRPAMLNFKLASKASENADMQNATQIAYPDVQKPKAAGKAGKAAARRIERAASRLQDAAEQLEYLLADLPVGDEQDDVHEALGRIMETQQIVAIAHARMRRTEHRPAR